MGKIRSLDIQRILSKNGRSYTIEECEMVLEMLKEFAEIIVSDFLLSELPNDESADLTIINERKL